MEVDNSSILPAIKTSFCEQGIDVLPTEIFQLILKGIFDGPDNDSLKSCTLVCSQWNAVCEIYIFQRIKIVNEGRLNDFKAMLDSKPDVGAYVYELVIQSTPQGHVPEPVEWLGKVPLTLSSHLPQLRTIEFVGLWGLRDDLAVDFFQELASFTSVTKLAVRNSFVALRMLQAFACALPALQELHIGETFPLPTNHLANAPPNLYSPSLTSLHLHLGLRYPESVDEGLAWALATRSRATLQSLSLLVYFSEASAVTEHLTVLGGQLRHLDLHLGISTGSPFEYEITKDNLHIHACTGLESLTLNCTVPTCPCMIVLLTEVSSPHIQKISIAISGNDVASLPDCRALAEPLNGVNIRNIAEVYFTYRGELALQDVLDKLRDDLPSIQFHVVTARINQCHEPGFPQQWDILGPYLLERSHALH